MAKRIAFNVLTFACFAIIAVGVAFFVFDTHAAQPSAYDRANDACQAHLPPARDTAPPSIGTLEWKGKVEDCVALRLGLATCRRTPECTLPTVDDLGREIRNDAQLIRTLRK